MKYIVEYKWKQTPHNNKWQTSTVSYELLDINAAYKAKVKQENIWGEEAIYRVIEENIIEEQ